MWELVCDDSPPIDGTARRSGEACIKPYPRSGSIPNSTSWSRNSGSMYPNWHSKGDIPVAKERRVLWVYLAHMRKQVQEDTTGALPCTSHLSLGLTSPFGHWTPAGNLKTGSLSSPSVDRRHAKTERRTEDQGHYYPVVYQEVG